MTEDTDPAERDLLRSAAALALRAAASENDPGASDRLVWHALRLLARADGRAAIDGVRPGTASPAPACASHGKETHMSRKLTAEFLGTLWLVLGGCGAAVLAAKFPEVGIGLTGVSFAFGLTLLTMALAIGHISGCHLNPAVTLGLATAGRIRGSEVPGYMLAQVLGACAGALILYVIASGGPGFSLEGGFAANGFAEHSPGKYGLGAAFLTESVMTFFFLMIILGATSERAPKGFAPIAIGLGLTLT